MPTSSDPATRPLRVAVLGCGAQGRNHLNAYSSLPGIKIAAICDLDETRRNATGEQYGVPETRRFSDYRDLLTTSGPLDIVSICTMPVSHREMTVASLDAGANVICEKPTALNLAEAQAMHEAAIRNGRILTVGFNMRFLPAAQFLKRYVDEGGIGAPVWGHAWTMATDIPWWGKHYVKAISGGGVLASTAVHILDLALWMVGRGNPTPTTVSCSMATLYPRKRAGTAPSPEAHAGFDVEDTFNAHIRFTDGTFLSLTGGWSHDQPAYSYSFELVGDRAAIQFAPLRVVEERNGKPVDITPELPPVETSQTGMDDWGASVVSEIADLVNAIRTGSTPTVRFEQAMTVQAIVDACYRSAELGREVEVAPIGATVAQG